MINISRTKGIGADAPIFLCEKLQKCYKKQLDKPFP